jgi:hypothetical protein
MVSGIQPKQSDKDPRFLYALTQCVLRADPIRFSAHCWPSQILEEKFNNNINTK